MSTEDTWADKPEDARIIDDAFWIKRQNWGTYVSIDRKGKGIVTALTESVCESTTRFILKVRQEESANRTLPGN